MPPKRKLAAILSADVAGYSRLMGDNEQATIATLKQYKQVFAQHITAHDGRVVDSSGDALLAEFSSAVEAVTAASEIQRELANSNRPMPEQRRMHFRVGINLGDVTEQDGALYGDGVNIAARLEALASPGGICVSGNVHDQVEGKLPTRFNFGGEQAVKNIAKPVRAYHAVLDFAPSQPSRTPRKGSRALILLVLLLGVIGGVVAVARFADRPDISKGLRREDIVLAMPKGPAIAVLPFSNLSGDPKQDYFADGLTEQIIADLSRFRDLFVTARNSTFRYKGQAVDIRQLGKDLGARYVLEGSLRQDVGRIRVTAQLLDAQTGAHLWAETYERELTAGAIFKVQDDITSHVVGAIGGSYGAISRATWEQSKAKGTTNLDAYHCVLVTREYWRTNAEADHLRARECLERAVKLDPDYAEAWAMLAMVYGEEHMFGYNLRPDPIGRAFNAAQRAIAIDPNHQRAQESLANVYFYRNDIDSFFPQAERAVALNPNNEDTLANMGLYMTYIGMMNQTVRERGLSLVKKAMALNRSHPGWYHFPTAWSHWWKGEYEQALAEATKINQPDLFWTYVTFLMIQGASGQTNETASHLAQLQRLYPDFPGKVREEWRKWNVPEAFIDRGIEHLRRAGVKIPVGE
jgi:adenylate cyclase